MATWRNIVEHSMVELGSLVVGESADVPNVNHNFARLKWLIDSWALSGLLIQRKVTFTHTVATDSDEFHIQRDDALLRTRYLGYTQPHDTYECELILLARDRLEAERGERIEHQYPPRCYAFEPGSDGSANHHYYLDSNALCGAKLRFVGDGNLVDSSGIALDDESGLEESYPRALMLALAYDLAPSYGVNDRVSLASLAMRARDAKNMIRRMNARPIGTPLPREYDGYTHRGYLFGRR